MRQPMASILAPAFFAFASASASELQAQEAERRPSESAAGMGALSRQRSKQWADAAPVIHCGPAPLTERPGSSAEVTRPRIVPLEAAFLDAASVKRTLAARTQPAAGKP
jgi:hypothetical protein